MPETEEAERRRTCLGKQAHASKKAAKDHIRYLKRQSNERELKSYPCRFCQNFHVARNPPPG